MDIKELVNNTTESSEIDFKVDLPKEKKHHKNWLKDVSAFANTNGGTIIWGIDDKTRELVGVHNAIKKSEIITEAINDKIKPYPPSKIKIIKYENKDFIIVDVDAGVNTPYYLWTDGTKEAYLRKGLSSIPADSLELNNLVMDGKHLPWDAQASDVAFDKATFKNFEDAYERYAKKELTKKDYEPLGLATLDGYLTNAGRLFSDEGIDYSQVFCTKWRGLNKMEAVDSKDFSGSLITLLDQAEAFVKNHTKQSWKIGNTLNRITKEEYPLEAIREAIINALAHRSYHIVGSEVHIDIYTDRLTIYSPGGMPNKGIIQKLDIFDLDSIRRNKVICSVFNYMDFMERRGSGLARIYESYDDFDKKPVFSSDTDRFKVTFPSKMYEVDEGGVINGAESGAESGALNKLETEVFAKIKNNMNITRKELSKELSKGTTTIYRAIDSLKEKGYIKREGSDRSGHWKILK